MTVKDHYEKYLANFYAWMIGDFEEAKDQFIRWKSPVDIKAEYANASILKSGRVVFNICGNK